MCNPNSLVAVVSPYTVNNNVQIDNQFNNIII